MVESRSHAVGDFARWTRRPNAIGGMAGHTRGLKHGENVGLAITVPGGK